MGLKPEILQSYYEVDEHGRYRIDVRLGRHYAIFDELDPAPVEKRCLSTNVGQYVESSVEELPVHAPIVLDFYLEMPSSLRDVSKEAQTTRGIRNYFLFHYRLKAEEVRATRQHALTYILMAVVLAIVQVLSKISAISRSAPFAAALWDLLQTGLTVCTWVFLWEGISIIAFQLPPLQARLIRSRKLLDTEIRYFYTAGRE